MDRDYTTFFHKKSPIRSKPEPEQPTINEVVFVTDNQSMKISDRFAELQKLAKQRGIQYDTGNASENTGIDNLFENRKHNLLIRLGARVNCGNKIATRNKITKPCQRENRNKNYVKTHRNHYRKFHYRSSRSAQISKRQLDSELDFYMANVGHTKVSDDQVVIKEEVANIKKSMSCSIDMDEVKKLFGGFGGPNWSKSL